MIKQPKFIMLFDEIYNLISLKKNSAKSSQNKSKGTNHIQTLKLLKTKDEKPLKEATQKDTVLTVEKLFA